MINFLQGLTSFEKKVILVSALSSIFLFLYSFTQVDLGLTLTRASFFTDIQRAFQYIGYFNRPLSTFLFLLLVAAFFALYIFIVKAVMRKKISEKALLVIIFVISLVLAFSYAAFSYDIFNYIFDAKIVTYYQQNPYLQKALDFPGDPMLSFMHWTHRTYPYGPIWLLITVPLSFIGSQLFLPTYFLFKLLSVASYLASILAILKIAKKIMPNSYLTSVALFALNPIVIFETLVSGHNDLAMMALSLFGIYFLLSKKYFLSYILLFLSIGIKFATVLLLPLFLLAAFFREKYALSPQILFRIATILMIIAVIVVSLRTNFQPWYLLYVLPLAALIQKKYVYLPMGVLSVTGLLNYPLFLYTGNFDSPIPDILVTINCLGVFIAVMLFAYFKYKTGKVK